METVTTADRTRARTVGILFIVASAAAVVGGSLVLPVEDAATPADLLGDRVRIASGALLEIILVVAVVAIAVTLYPVLRRHDAGLALGYVAARTLEGAALLAAAASALVAVALGDAGSVAHDPAVADLVATTRRWAYDLGSLLLFGVGALVLYWLLLRMRAVPVWLSLWGLAGAGLVVARGVLGLYDVELSGAVEAVLTAPIGLNEMVLAVWLIVRGLDRGAAPAP